MLKILNRLKHLNFSIQITCGLNCQVRNTTHICLNNGSKMKNSGLNKQIEVVEVYKKEKLSVKKLCKGFKIGKSQAADIIKNKESLLNKWTSNSNLDERGSFLLAKGPELIKSLITGL